MFEGIWIWVCMRRGGGGLEQHEGLSGGCFDMGRGEVNYGAFFLSFEECWMRYFFFDTRGGGGRECAGEGKR